MKGNDKILAVLNDLLALELTAINQYFVHAEMCENWGYKRLHIVIRNRSIEEMKHAENLIARILFLDGQPVVSRLNPIHIGSSVVDQLDHDHQEEQQAVNQYNKGIEQAVQLLDNGTRELLESILKDEEAHIDWIEAQKSQIDHMGVQSYLSEQID